jgi:hypothetical protein
MSVPCSPFVVRANPRNCLPMSITGAIADYCISAAGHRAAPASLWNRSKFFRTALTVVVRNRRGGVAPKSNLSYHRSRKQ